MSHAHLLAKLCQAGITGTTLYWIKDFLHNRTQRVVVNGQISSACSVTSGVPQGSVLGPLLFLIYINDLPNSINQGTSVRLFADDCALYRQIQTCQDSKILQEDLNRLQLWENRWLMNFNASKCFKLSITNKRKPLLTSYKVHDTVLTEQKSAKYLGLIFDNKLTWNKHINAITKKADGARAFINRNLRSAPPLIKSRCITTMVRPILEYACEVWDPHTQSNINALERVNRRCARTVYND